MFVVSLTYKKDLKEVDRVRDEHINYLKKYYSLKKFIVSGPKIPRTGGVILANVSSKEELDKILKEDPFHINNIANYDVTEFDPKMMADGFKIFTDSV